METRLAVPLIVGVIGHRDLRSNDITALEQCVGSVFDGFEKRCPHTKIILLNALAAGADMLVARVALQRGIEVIACLPYAIDRHVEKFDEGERAEARAILAKCAQVRIAPYNVSEAEAYVRNGRYISDNSNELVALWDGSYNDEPGGTGDIVKYRLTGPRPKDAAYTRLFTPEAASVYQIVSPRSGNPDVVPSIRVERLLPEITSMDQANVRDTDDEMLDGIDRFNSDLLDLDPPARRSGGLSSSVQHAADRLANGYQQKTIHMMNWLYLLVFVAASAQTVCVMYPHPITQFIIGFIKVAAIIAAAAVYLLTRNTDYQNRYQDYRALSEGLRVQIAWRAAGLSDSVELYYLRMHQGDLQWIRSALRTIAFVEKRPEATSLTYREAVAWVTGQARYYGYRGQVEQGNQHKSESIAKVLAVISGTLSVLVGALLAVTGALLNLLSPHPAKPLTALFPALRGFLIQHLHSIQPTLTDAHVILNDAFPIILGLVPLSALILMRYAEQRGFKTAANRYARMHRFFDMGESRLDKVEPAEKSSREIMYELGKVALAEHTDWLVSGRERPISAVRGAAL